MKHQTSYRGCWTTCLQLICCVFLLLLTVPSSTASPLIRIDASNQHTQKENYKSLRFISQNKVNKSKNDLNVKSMNQSAQHLHLRKISVGNEKFSKGNVTSAHGHWHVFSELECNLCKLIVTVLRSLMAQKKTESEMRNALTHFCIDMGIEDKTVCTSVILEFQDEVLTVIQKLALSPDEICGYLFGDGCAKVYNPYMMWNVSLTDTPKPPVKPPKPPKPGSPVIRVLQLSDIHLDLDYQAGSNANCGEPLCCHRSNGPPKGTPAGQWGDYRQCDTPPWLLENLFLHLKTKEKFDLIYWTGDLPNHQVWNQTRRGQQELEGHLTKLFLQYFPDIPVYSSLGNHESAPANSFPPPFVKGDESIDWLYQTIASNWTVWLPNSTVPDLLKGGYYTTLVRPGLRIISVNTNYCNNMNWWLLLNTTDPAEELQWLVRVLQTAEDKHEKVHIIGHIPPGIATCLQAWSWNYYKIINRYENIVAGQFFGHTHTDYVAVFYDDVKYKRPVSVSYVSPSVTTYASALGTNPSYRIYEIDGGYGGASWEVLNHETHMINLTEANLTPKKPPTWYMEYNAKEAYNMTGLYPADWDKLIDRMLHDDQLFEKYYQFYYHGHLPKGKCDHQCKLKYLCEARSGRSHDQKTFCSHLL